MCLLLKSWALTPYCLVEACWCFRGTYCSCLQGQWISWANEQQVEHHETSGNLYQTQSATFQKTDFHIENVKFCVYLSVCFSLLQAKYPLALCGDLRFADRKNRSFKTYLFEFSQAKLCYYKDKRVSTPKNVTAAGIDDWGVIVWVPAPYRIFTSSWAFGPTHPPLQRVVGAFSLGIKRPVPEADCSPSTHTKVQKTWVCTSTPPTSSWRSA
jgi:hypothetical protein